MPPLKISDASFQNDVLNASKPVVVDFWAEWCSPCRMIAPALEELSAELQDKVTVAKLNIDESPATPQKYGVRGVPTLMIFHRVRWPPPRSARCRNRRSRNGSKPRFLRQEPRAASPRLSG